MEKIDIVRSRTVVMPGTDIDTDQIVPARFLTTTTRKGLGKALFADWRYDKSGKPKADFVLNTPAAAGCRILVTGNNFGCGSSREHAPWALLDFGIQAVISTGIADIFRSNSLKNGLLPVVVDKATHTWLLENPGIELTIDVASCQLQLPDGKSVSFPLDGFSKYCLLNGVDQLGYLLHQSDAITRFESERSWKPLIGVLPGDGIGPEVMTEALRALRFIEKKYRHQFVYREALIGGIAIDSQGHPFPADTRKLCAEADAVLLGAVGGPKWSNPDANVRPEQGLLGMRAAMGVFANLRPVRTHPALYAASPLRSERLAGVDILVVRELTGGAYFGRKERTPDAATDVCTYTRTEIERVLRMAGELARTRRRKITSIDKANVLETSRLWRSIATELYAREFPDVRLDHMYVDAAAMHLLSRAADFDVMVTENLFGDILTDEASMLTGSLGMLPSASLNAEKRGLYEPIHGSAPDIAGRGIANPCATILSAAMLLRHSLGMETEARAIEQAVITAIESGCRTADIALQGKSPVSTRDMGDAVLRALEAQ